MAEFKLVISEEGKSYKKTVSGSEATVLVGKKLGDVIKADALGLAGYELQITGGSDKCGFPMRKGYHGGGVREILLSSGTGFNPKKRGERRKKRIRGATITDQISQVNLAVKTAGQKNLSDLLAASEEKPEEGKPEEKKEESKPEEKKEEKPAEEKKEETKPKEKPVEGKPEETKEEPKPAEEKPPEKKEEKPAEEKPK